MILRKDEFDFLTERNKQAIERHRKEKRKSEGGSEAMRSADEVSKGEMILRFILGAVFIGWCKYQFSLAKLLGEEEKGVER